MTNLLLTLAASGIIRTAHYLVPNGRAIPERTLLLEGAATNLLLRSQEFDHATWTKTSASVSANAIAAPDGTTTADQLTASATSGSVSQVLTVTGDGTKAVAVFLKRGTALVNRIAWVDTSPLTTRHRVEVTWTDGVPAVTSIAGAGTIFPVRKLSNGWYRIEFTADGVVAAGVNNVVIYPDSAAGTGTVYAWGAQAEDAGVPSSYIATTSATVTRAADALYLSLPRLNPPRALTVYARGIERQAPPPSGTTGLLFIGGAGGSTDPRLGVYRNSPAGYATQHDNGITPTNTSLVGATVARGDLVEVRGVLGADGACLTGVSINDAAEAVSARSTAQPLAAAWNDTRLYLNSWGTGSVGAFAFTHVAIAEGELPLETMRRLAGVRGSGA